ncbi:UDP-glycosyltransferase 83A1-like [Durio zibethinus]|uniref:UDP-glycosyltransferase 83A1-like n=1 Tax=Durio zibethinus TaxID=66656 RepID=A0A6P5YCB0_DURZI|nr:UDP-glycosyltransferase 83A1-like [Durio zibethinus]
MDRQPHVLVIPFPAKGHVAPLMKLSLQFAAQGVKVTFVNTEVRREKIMASLPEKVEERSLISLVSIPVVVDEDGPNDGGKVTETIHRVMRGFLEDLIVKINQSNVNEKITCVIADTSVGWAVEVTKKVGLEAVAVWPAGAACLALAVHIPQLLDAGIINTDGIVMNDEPILLSEDIPAWSSSDIGWKSSDPVKQKAIFEFYTIVPDYAKFYDWVLCNSVYELDSSVLKLIPNVLPIGPLLASSHLGVFAGNTWPEDSTCLDWLDKQTAGSVIYVAFGSSTIICAQQVDELALGLELAGNPFLWVFRSNFWDGSTVRFPDGFKNRVAERAKFVEWAPQEKVLAHPSVSCFISHCGWNSTMEGLSMGLPFLCWPYIADQFSNKNYICDVLKIGLDLTKDENGITTRHEICTKINTLLSSDVIKANALHIKEIARKSSDEGGSSFKNFKNFIQHIKNL